MSDTFPGTDGKDADLPPCAECGQRRDEDGEICRPVGEGNAFICYACAFKPENKARTARNRDALAAANPLQYAVDELKRCQREGVMPPLAECVTFLAAAALQQSGMPGEMGVRGKLALVAIAAFLKGGPEAAESLFDQLVVDPSAKPN